MKFYKLRSILNKRGFRCSSLEESETAFSFKPTLDSELKILKEQPEIVGLFLDSQQGTWQFNLEEANLVASIMMRLTKPDPLNEIPPDEMQGFINFSRDQKAEDAEELHD
jgi:hypothetical protein